MNNLQLVREGIAADLPGPLPLDIPDAELESYCAVRSMYDESLQIAAVKPLAPQRHCTSAVDYERQLLGDLARHTQQYSCLDTTSIPNELLRSFAERIIADARTEPHRLGRLREVVKLDRTGRECREFHGPKTWMNQFKAPRFLSPIYVDGQPQRVPVIL